MIIIELWKSNRERSGGRFNRCFFWMYPLVLPLCLIWDVLEWLEKILTPRNGA